ncbi:repressor of RNA polymerase iii transcription maf1 [Anaeramoeba flamelloides]|uniref:Repressor of RNA polymerase iii transcription maf1 n=1 Tax=Anaeramoeba flamelloides TaxID=1746091 RepID=A0AAV7YVX5_9EUKA|nr:repressor of RNA polymerase iii transcription maf1 [Anaeramoeba flamelloides]KAJ6246857.1 repressor of RNA polymerase iii transcription maf1 [Anaeramoeba flamelloides]|eukprot:Anaeramoba_flamelloidesa577011_52.p1 GENE.a577011_52~~a577011_52.p1  ORF type:complete len:235 (+),score=40.50 a577011_52:102-806(+)
MEFINHGGLNQVINDLNGLITATGVIMGTLEVCRLPQEKKRLPQQTRWLEQKLVAELTLPKIRNFLATHEFKLSPRLKRFGSLKDPIKRKTLVNLISALNLCYPEYDFSDLREKSFTRVSNLKLAQNGINTTLNSIVDEFYPDKCELFWSQLDEVVDLDRCSVYCYVPGLSQDDPFSEIGVAWSMNYFFVNNKTKRLVFFALQCVSFSSECAKEMYDQEEEIEFPSWCYQENDY